MSDLVLLDRPADGVARLTLNRPEKKNALSSELRRAGNAVLADLAADDSVRVLVVTGAGDVFSAGFDLKEFDTALRDAAFGNEVWASSDEWHQRWLTFPVPTVAAVNGPALAGGLDVAVMCDLRIAAETATFAHPEIRFGDVVYGPLHDLVGGAVARDLCFTGRRIDAAEAHRVGLVGQVVAVAALETAALATAGEIALAPRDVLVRTKAKAVRAARVNPERTLDL